MKLISCIVAALPAAFLLGCASIDVKEMALQEAPVANNTDINKTLSCRGAKYALTPLLGVAAETMDARALEARAMTLAKNKIDEVTDPYEQLKGRVPESLRGTAVIETVIRSAKLAAAGGVQEAFLAQNITSLDARPVKAIRAAMEFYGKANLNAPASLSTKDFRRFTDEFSEQMLRHTKGKGGDNADFWELLHTYYSAYAEGKFVDYFGTQYAKPTVALTVTDAELANVVGVFLELTFDAAGRTPVWTPVDDQHTGDLKSGSKQLDNITNGDNVQEDVSTIGWEVGMSISDADNAIPSGTIITAIDAAAPHPGLSVTLSNAAIRAVGGARLTVTPAKKTYYPAASTNEPSALALTSRNATSMSLNPKSVGCGMTIIKAKAINSLAQSFGSAASNSAGAAVGTIGGVGFSLGIFGKLSVGDNKAITSLIEATVSELVKRLTVEATYPVLENVAFNAPPHDSSYHLTSPFSSPNKTTPVHYNWLP
jgi:hypothetical protein